MSKKYTTPELATMFSITQARLQQFRDGETQRRKGKDGVKEYSYPPLLERGKDWDWEDGNIIYKQSAVRKLEQRLKK